MNRFKKYFFYAITAFITSTHTSCVKDTIDFSKSEQQTWDPNLAIPLVYSSLSVENILANSNQQGTIQIDNDNLCYVVYKGNLVSFKASDLIVIPPQTYAYTVMFSGSQLTSLQGSGSITLNYTQTISFNAGSADPSIDSLIYKSGLLTDSILSNFKQSGQVKITIPFAKKGNTVFTQTLPLNYTGSLPVVAKNSVDLNGYHFDMTLGGTTTNSFVIDYEVTLNYSGANPPSTSDKIEIFQNITNPKFDKIFGYIGQHNLIPSGSDKDTVEISIFNSTTTSGLFSLADPRLKFIISNSFGVPVNVNVIQFKGFTPPSSSFPITSSGIPSPIIVPLPTITQIGQTKIDSFTIDNTNSNIASIFANTPHNLVYQLSSLSNPQGKVSQNFIVDSSRIQVDMEVKIPLDGTIKNLVLNDTIKDFKFDFGEDIEVKSLLLRTYTANKFPTDVGLQIYFVDSTHALIDSLYSTNVHLLESGLINSSGKVISPTIKNTDITLDAIKIKKLEKTRSLIIVGIISTTNNGTTNVKIHSDNTLDVKLGAQILASVKLNH